MVSAPARRELVRHMIGCGLSERRSLRIIGMSASAYLPRLRIQGVQLLCADHGWLSCRAPALHASVHPAIASDRSNHPDDPCIAQPLPRQAQHQRVKLRAR